MMVASIPVPTPVDIAVAKRVGKEPCDVTQADRDKVLRDLIDRRGAVPLICDREQIPAAPARGPVLLFHPRQAVITDTGNVATERTGRFAAMQVQDGFHKAQVHARSRKQPEPFTPGQVNIGREYAALFHRCESSGMKLSQIGGAGGGSGALGVSEAVLADMQRLAWLTKRIGGGVALTIRRVRPSKRAGSAASKARNVTSMRLVEDFCAHGETISAILRAHGWSDYTGNKKLLHAVLCANLNRMSGH